jgi:hypothetical protein
VSCSACPSLEDLFTAHWSTPEHKAHAEQAAPRWLLTSVADAPLYNTAPLSCRAGSALAGCTITSYPSRSLRVARQPPLRAGHTRNADSYALASGPDGRSIVTHRSKQADQACDALIPARTAARKPRGLTCLESSRHIRPIRAARCCDRRYRARARPTTWHILHTRSVALPYSRA